MNKENKEEIISYSSFDELSDVCEMFEYEIEYNNFIKEKKVEINEFFKENILDDFADLTSHKNEYVICERLISPIISLISKNNKLKLWSHTNFKVKINKNLTFSGEPDYLWALPTVRGGSKFSKTVACLGEAKKDNFLKGWAQAGAEMLAAQVRNKNKNIPIYGLVSNGALWQLGKLEKNIFTIDNRSFSATDNLNKLFNVLNYFFCEVRKSADILQEIENREKTNKTGEENGKRKI